MQFTNNTRNQNNKKFLTKVFLILIIFIGTIILLSKIEFPYPNEDMEKIISNDKFKIIK
jgi:hypothetical protein